MLRRVLVGDNERVFLIRKGRFEDILAPGDYWIVGFGVTLERHDVKNLVLSSEWTDFLAKQRWELVSRYFTVVETADSQVAVVYFDDKVARIVGPGKRVLFWRGSIEVTYDLINAQENTRRLHCCCPRSSDWARTRRRRLQSWRKASGDCCTSMDASFAN